ncbi:hypothetical protein AZ270_gp79 [Acidianus tailed spindle virus]|nr:hypothetical protein AZ270_gp79 [Acidianus tailed spindle virus]AME30102.1 hypothetical protein ATSV_B46 [Acidianus tailed spindle virus]
MQILAIILVLFLIFLAVLVGLLPYFYAKTEMGRKKNKDEEEKKLYN